MKRILVLTLAILGAAAPVLRADNARINWKMYCAKCHGGNGKGNTRAGRLLGAPNYRSPKVQASFTNDQAFKAIKEGIRKDDRMKMKPFGGELTDQDIRDLVQYVRAALRLPWRCD